MKVKLRVLQNFIVQYANILAIIEMIQKKSKFLYHSCERVDHGELPMNKVCIDSRCSSNSLVCGDCIRADHLNHQVVSLGEFVERL